MVRCLALALPPLGLHASRVEDQPSQSFLGIVGDRSRSIVGGDGKPVFVRNVCKDNGRTMCIRKNKASCFWDWDEDRKQFVCLPKTCTNLYGSDCVAIPKLCVWDWDDETGKGMCLNKAQGAIPSLGFENPCRNLKEGSCRLESKSCDWDGEKCAPKTCAGIMGTDCQDLKTQCIWVVNRYSRQKECMNLPKDNPCRVQDNEECRSKPALCAWYWNSTTRIGACRPKTCSGIKGSDCKELSEQCYWFWNPETQIGKCLDRVVPAEDRNPCKYHRGEDCKKRNDTCMWDWDNASNSGTCRPLNCTGIKGSDCVALTTQCFWSWNLNTETGECLDASKAPPPLRYNTCKNLDHTDCHRHSEDCKWDLNKTSLKNYCRPKSCERITVRHCRELKGQCVWKWGKGHHPGDCLDVEGGSTETTTVVATRFRDNPCRGLFGNLCRIESENCDWLVNAATGAAGCRPKTCARIKRTHCKELFWECIWKWNATTETGECLDRPPQALTRENPCKNLTRSTCMSETEHCTWDGEQNMWAVCRPKTCTNIQVRDCLDLGNQCIWEWDDGGRTGHCVELPKAKVLVANPCKNLEDTDCTNKSQYCRWGRMTSHSPKTCRPHTCVGIKGSDCLQLVFQCLWKPRTGECVDLQKASTTSTTSVAKEFRDNSCKNLLGIECKNKSMHQYCAWDWNTETSKGNCRPKTCVGIKGSDCRELSSQCVWDWDDDKRIGCRDLPKAERYNPCKNLKGSECKNAANSEHCAWDWDKKTSTGNCRPRTCAGIKSRDCNELSSQCTWEWDHDTHIGECRDLPKALASSSTTNGELKDNPCKNLLGGPCQDKREFCAWDWDKNRPTGNCRPLTCAGIKGSDCRELSSQCTWKWDSSTQTGECLDLPKALTTASTTAVAQLKGNPCKNLQTIDCFSKHEDCAWVWKDWQASHGICRPHTCAGIKGSDCRELSEQCVWDWDTVSQTGSCLDLPEVSSTTPTPKPKLKDNPCKDLKGSLCRDKGEDCAWDWDTQTSTFKCRPRTCAGIKGTDCRDLTSQCAWQWDPISQSGECLDISQAAAATTTTAESGMANPCKDLRQSACSAKDDICNWNPLAKSCKPKTCVGLRGSDCRGLPYHCVWQWEADFSAGECLDIIPFTTATTTSTGSRTAWFISSLLVNLLVAMGLFVL